MASKNYQKGRNFEYQVKYFFEKLGWNVIRSAGSHSESDLIINKDNTTYFIQCKNDKKYVNTKFVKDIIKEIIEKDKIFNINNKILLCNRKILIHNLEKLNQIKENKTIIINENKIFNQMLQYLQINDILIINIPRKKTWLICLKK